MKALVVVTYVVLFLAVVGQAVHVREEAPGEPEKLEVRDVPNRSDSPQDIALDRTERLHEYAPVETIKEPEVHAEARSNPADLLTQTSP